MHKILLGACVVGLFAATLRADDSALTLNPTHTPATNEAFAQLENEQLKVEENFAKYVDRTISRYEPVYFIWGSAPATKFQLSGKYQLINSYTSDEVEKARQENTKKPWWSDFYFAYTQTTLWDTGFDSAPIFDTSYRPELFWSTEDVFNKQPADTFKTNFQTGFTHESNGKGGDDSRSTNTYFIEPIFTLVGNDGYFLRFAPKMKLYLGSMSDNDDITQYRGYVDLKFVLGQTTGVQAAILGRIGDHHADKGSVQLDVTVPMRYVWCRLEPMYLDVQIFNGFGESLLDYNESNTSLRVGLCVIR